MILLLLFFGECCHRASFEGGGGQVGTETTFANLPTCVFEYVCMCMCMYIYMYIFMFLRVGPYT